MAGQRIQSTIYYIFVLLTIATLVPAVLFFLGYHQVFKIYSAIYFGCILLYAWFRFINLAIYEIKRIRFGMDDSSSFTVLVPTYNEDPVLLKKAIHSVAKAAGNKKIMIIDDGSSNGIFKTIEELSKKYDNIITHRFEENKGKRHALYWAFQNVDTDFVITIDSDTVVAKDAFVYLLAPFKNKKIGATTGNVLLLNEKYNVLTRLTAGLYLSGLDNYKKAQSVLGNVTCCSGCLSAYRTDIIREIADPFVNQMFLGKIAAHSEDRFLTNLVLEKGYKVVYVEQALCFTESPTTLKGFLKQQQRWKRGFVRESIYLLSYSFKVSKLLFLEALIGNAIPYFLSFGIQVHMIVALIIDPLSAIPLFAGWIIFMTIREIPMFLTNPKRAIWFYFYIPLYECLLFWQNMWAIFTVTNKNWLTRNLKQTDNSKETNITSN